MADMDASSGRSWLCGQGVLSWATAGSVTGHTGNANSNLGGHGDWCAGTQLAPNKTECHFLFLSNAVLFQHCLLTALVQRFGGRGGGGEYMEKRKEKSSQLHKAFPWKSPGSGVLRHGAALPLPSGALALLVEAQMGIHPIPHVRELSGRGRMAACVYIYISLCVYIYIYNRLY